MNTHSISGGGGITLHIQETGPAAAQPILLIHGFSQCGLAWTNQMRSELAREFRLIAMDIRGHGLSEKPRDAYGDSALWAEDVRAVITTLDLAAPVLVGWSYAGVIILDYIQQYGDERIAGIQLVSAVSRLGDPLLSGNFLGGQFLSLVPGFFSEDAIESVSALRGLVRLCQHAEPSFDDTCLLLGSNVIVPPYVRQGLLSRNLDHDAIFTRVRRPVSLVYGEADEVVSPRMCRHLEQLLPGARVSAYAGTGHMPFWEQPDRFNGELAEFARACQSSLKPSAASL